MSTSNRWLASLAVFTLIAGAVVSPVTFASSACDKDRAEYAKPKHGNFLPPAIFVRYRTVDDCVIYPNYPKPGVKGQKFAWTVPSGKSLEWRYNVNDTWAVVSDPKRHKSKFPWWGFTRRSCLGRSLGQSEQKTGDYKHRSYPDGVALPDRILEGRSRLPTFCEDDYFRAVDYHQGPASVVKHGVKVKRDATMRDKANFVVGNVFAGWKVDVTNHPKSASSTNNKGWVYVYSPSARKWGYVRANKLDL